MGDDKVVEDARGDCDGIKEDYGGHAQPTRPRRDVGQEVRGLDLTLLTGLCGCCQTGASRQGPPVKPIPAEAVHGLETGVTLEEVVALPLARDAAF